MDNKEAIEVLKKYPYIREIKETKDYYYITFEPLTKVTLDGEYYSSLIESLDGKDMDLQVKMSFPVRMRLSKNRSLRPPGVRATYYEPQHELVFEQVEKIKSAARIDLYHPHYKLRPPKKDATGVTVYPVANCGISYELTMALIAEDLDLFMIVNSLWESLTKWSYMPDDLMAGRISKKAALEAFYHESLEHILDEVNRIYGY